MTGANKGGLPSKRRGYGSFPPLADGARAAQAALHRVLRPTAPTSSPSNTSLREVWPLLEPGYILHIIAGMHRERYRVNASLHQSGIEIEGFVPDVRNAYQRAEIVLAPLTASAGTNIKILEAMAMGKLVISTPAGINGLDLRPGSDLIVVNSAAEMARKIRTADRRSFEIAARAAALRYSWKEIADLQTALYDEQLLEINEPRTGGSANV